jgi:hypothetical protein
LEQLLAWSLAHPVTVDFAAMKLPLPQFRPGALATPLPMPDPETFKPKPLTRLTRLMPGAEERFAARWEQGRVAYDRAWAIGNKPNSSAKPNSPKFKRSTRRPPSPPRSSINGSTSSRPTSAPAGGARSSNA